MTIRLRLPEDTPANKPERKLVPDHIPHVKADLIHGSAECARCGGKLRRLGGAVTEELEYGPAPPPRAIVLEPVANNSALPGPMAENGSTS